MKYAFANATILDGSKEMKPQPGKVILTDDMRITEIKDMPKNMENLRKEGFEIVDVKGGYVMPGLINMHVHLAGNGKPQKKQRDNTKLVNMIFSNPISAAVAKKLVRKYAQLELYSGVTTIRTVGGLKDLDTRVRDEILTGKIEGPRILASNEGISVKDGHMAGSVAIQADTIEQAIAQVHRAKEQDADLIKLMITGGVMDAKEKGVPGEMKMKPEMVKAVCEEAHKLGFIVAAHVESPMGVKVALENGVDSIEHGAKPTEEIVKLFKESGACLVTTLSPALPYALFDRSVSNASEVEQFNGNVVFEGIRDCAIEAIKNDIPVALGNDVGCPWITQYDFWRELVYFKKYTGVTNAFALYTATKRAAELAGIGEVTGTVEPGKCADLIVTEKNPLEDLRALREVKMVMARGQLIENPKIKRNKKVDAELDKFL